MEMHLVHANNDGELAVVGVFIEEGKFNPFFDRVIKNMPSQSGEHARPKTEMLSAAHLLPDDQLYYHFMGSLTTPPCSEGVNWNVLRQPIQVSSKQIKAFQKLYKSNSRPVQPLYGRVVKY